jgi:hypothetical protein
MKKTPLRFSVLVASILGLSAPPLPGASTGTASLQTPQGSGAPSSNGDYATSTAGLNGIYRYFVEAPPGLGRLVVQLFDADVGAGGAGEAAAGRDRARGGFNTTAEYRLIGPEGTARATAFTTGDTAGPAGADNAWLSLYDATGDSWRDDFNAVSYSNDDGSLPWATAWIESNDSGNPATGVIRVTGGELRLRENGGAPSMIERQASLTGSGATLAFDFRTSNNVDANDRARVEVSNDGGGSWTTLETFTGSSGGASRLYDVSAWIAANTRVRFSLVGGYGGSESFFVDNVELREIGVRNGHWEVRVDLSSSVTAGDDINALGLRAHDGTAGGGGTELNVYADSLVQYGVNPPTAGTNTRAYAFHPWITSGCTASGNDFDYDSNRGDTGSLSFTSRTGSFSQTFGAASLSADDVWRRNTVTGWTSDLLSTDYGIWSLDAEVRSYLVGTTQNGNYANLYAGGFAAAVNPPAGNPVANAFRTYLPTDAGAAPAKPYLEQLLTHKSGPNPVAAGQTTRVAVTVRLVNPTTWPIVFSTPSNVVTARVPGAGAVYAGSAQVAQGAIVSQPAVGGTGDVVWNPGTLAAGATAILAYEVDVTPALAGQRVAVTATPASGAGTRALYLDETANAAQARATSAVGPVCELAISEGLLTPAVVSSFSASADRGATVVEWATASEAGTAGFVLHRLDPAAGAWAPVHDGLLPAVQGSPQGGVYRFTDGGAAPGEPHAWLLEEVEADGGRRFHGPYSPGSAPPSRESPEAPPALAARDGSFAAHPHPPSRRAPSEAAASRALWDQAERERGLPVQALRLAVGEPGLYRLSGAELADAFEVARPAVERWIERGRLALTSRGLPVAWAPDAGTDGLGIVFFAEGIDSVFAAENVYRLARGEAGRVMPAAAVQAAPGAAADGGFPETVRAESDALPATVLSLDPDSDWWFWDFLLAGDATFGRKAFALDAPSPTGTGAAELKVHLQGATATGLPGEHRVEVRLNGAFLGELQWQGIAPASAAFPVDSASLLETGNAVELEALRDPGVPYGVVYVDSFELTYRRLHRAAGDTLAFRGEAGPEVAVEGFSGPGIRLLDVSDPARPRRLEGAAVQPSPDGTWLLAFRPPSPGTDYLAAGPGAAKRPEVRPWRGLRLAPILRADVLVIVPEALRSGAERLADLREDGGLRAAVATVEEVADHFGHGFATPEAIRRFLAGVVAARGRARYVVLAGAGSVDYRDLLGHGGNLVPPALLRTPEGLFAADNPLADVDGDGLPDLAIGRIPAHTLAELEAYVDKLAAYESDDRAGWPATALLLADAPDRGADFSQANDRLAALLPAGSTVERIDLGTTPLGPARDRLFAALDAGAGFVSYVGHGGLDRLSAGGLLTRDDVPALANGPRLPVVTAMTCTVNRFGVPGVQSLGEALVTHAAGGAVAVWAPAGLSIDAEARLLAERFYRLAGDGGAVRLGDLLLRSFGEFRALGGSEGLPAVYNLLGDPALRLRKPRPRAPETGGVSGE